MCYPIGGHIKAYVRVWARPPAEKLLQGAFEGPFFLVAMERNIRNQLVDAIQAQVLTEGFECVEVEWIAADRVLRIYIDHPGGINLDQCAEVTRKLQETELLDKFLSDEFDIEVSSPGLDRPLRCQEHFQKSIGQKIRVELIEPCDGRKAGRGILKAVGTDGKLTMDTSRGDWSFSIDKIDSANVEYQWPERGAKTTNIH